MEQYQTQQQQGENKSRTEDIERRKHEVRQIEEDKKETERLEKAKKKE
jgi:hypothetical protein